MLSPAQSQPLPGAGLSRSRRVAGIAPGHGEALPILITTSQMGAKAGQVEVHTGLLPWHCNPPSSPWTGHTANNFPFRSKWWWKPAAPGGLCAYNCRKKHPCQRDSLTEVKLGTNPLGPFHLILVFLTSASVSRICSQALESQQKPWTDQYWNPG